MSQALNNTGRDMWLNFHCWHDADCAKCGNSFRVFHDHHDDWGSTSSTIDFLANNRQPFWGPDPDYGWPDADFIYTGGEGCGSHSPPGQRCPGQSEVEYVSEFSIWAIAQGQLVLATDPRNMTAFMKKVLFNKEVLDVFRDVSGFRDVVMIPSNTTPPAPGPVPAVCSVALKKQISRAACTAHASFDCVNGSQNMWTDDGCRGEFTCNGLPTTCDVDNAGRHTCDCGGSDDQVQTWLRPTADGGAAAVLHNPTDSAADVSVTFADVPKRGWSEQTSIHVRDLWVHKDLGSMTNKFVAKGVPSHGSVFVKLAQLHA